MGGVGSLEPIELDQLPEIMAYLLCLLLELLFEFAIFLEQLAILVFYHDELGRRVIKSLFELLDLVVVGLEQGIEERQVLVERGLVLHGVIDAAFLAGQVLLQVVLDLEVAVQLVELAPQHHVCLRGWAYWYFGGLRFQSGDSCSPRAASCS